MARLEAIETALGSAGGRPYSPALRAGEWLLVPQIPIDETGASVGAGDPGAQWRRTLENVRIFLEAANASLRDVVKLKIFVTDIRFYLDYQDIVREFFSEPFPVQTVVGVTCLAQPEWVVEIEAMAYLGVAH